MKPYTLCTYLLPLLLVTAQASQQNLNTDNQLQQEDLKKWQQHTHLNMDEVEKSLKKLYENGIEKTLPLYFVYGPTGSGKSTLIYALQGNKIIKKEKIEIKKEREKRKSNHLLGLSNNKISTGKLKLEKTVNVPIPEVSRSQHQQESVKIYYTGKEIKKSMAFCDTEDYVILEENFTPSRYSINLKEDKDIIRAYAPYFTLKSNKIRGIVFVISEAIDVIRVNKHVNYLLEHFKEDVLSKNKETLKKSIILVINKIQKNDKKALDYLNDLTSDSIEAYNNRLNLRDNYSHLSFFLALFLNDDNEIDLEHVHYFHPYDPKNVQKLREKLANLKPIDPKLFKYKQPKDLVNQYKPKPKPSPKQKSPSPVIYQTSTQETNVEREQQQDEVSIQPGQQDNLNNPSQQQNDLQNIKDPIQEPVIDPLDKKIEELRKDRVEELKYHIRQKLLQNEPNELDEEIEGLKQEGEGLTEEEVVGGGLDNQDNPSNPSQQHTQQDIDGNQSEDDSNNLSDTQEEEHNLITIPPKPPSPDIEDKTQDDSNNLSDTQEEEHNSTTIPKPPLPDIDQNKNLYKNLGIAGVLAISTVGLLYLMNKNSSTKQKKSKKSSDLPTNQVAENLQ